MLDKTEFLGYSWDSIDQREGERRLNLLLHGGI